MRFQNVKVWPLVALSGHTIKFFVLNLAPTRWLLAFLTPNCAEVTSVLPVYRHLALGSQPACLNFPRPNRNDYILGNERMILNASMVFMQVSSTSSIIPIHFGKSSLLQLLLWQRGSNTILSGRFLYLGKPFPDQSHLQITCRIEYAAQWQF